LHDIGYCGLNYLTNKEIKNTHVARSAHIAGKILWPFSKVNDIEEFIMGHLGTYSTRSDLYLPDKSHWLIMPKIWYQWIKWVEGYQYNYDEWLDIVGGRITYDREEWKSWG
jgi:hypothetical protein